MFILVDDELNPEQVNAILDKNNIFLIACPGSGKTRTLTYKIAHELSQLTSRKKYIIAITYTNRAADEIHERIENMGLDTKQLWIGTIHAFCLEWIIRPYAIYNDKLNHGYSVINSHDSEKIFTELCSPYKTPNITYWDCGYTATPTGYTLHCTDPRKKDSLDEIFDAYFNHLSENKLIDFEMILYHSYKLLTSNKSISVLLSNMFEYMLVDEYQDTKEIQYSILSTIIKSNANKTKIFVVGDPNQAIYTTLGGYPISIDEFSELCGISFKPLSLEKNYRSSEKIIQYFNEYNLHDTKIEAFSKDKDYLSKITFNNSIHKDNIADEIAKLIQKNINEYGIAQNEICILAPWWVHLATMTRRLMTKLPEYNFDGPGMVPFSRDIENFWYKLAKIALTKASPDIYIRRIRWARDILTDLISAGINTDNLTSKKLLTLSNSIHITENDGLLYLEKYFEELFKELNIDFRNTTLLKNHYDAFFESSQARIQRLIKEGSTYLSDISSFRKVFERRSGITVSTIHSIKGAEFDTVIAYALLDDIVPHFNDPEPENSANKLLYVISSRAKKHLHLISELGRGYGGSNKPISPPLARYNYNYDDI